jgi:NAD(P)-dependent dehydrogenase (short-subunit alcohol dehydrogenase family)
MANILITGHSRGLGAAMTSQLLAQGHHVLGLSRRALAHPNPDHFDRLQEISIDLGDPIELESLFSPGMLMDFFRDCDQAILINNAGRLLPIGQADTLVAADTLQSITANTTAPILLTTAFLAATKACRDRRILQISSGAGRSPYSGWSIYCATKAALDHFSRCVHAEGHQALRIESLAPGIIDTDMQAQVRATSLEAFPMRPKFDALKASGALARPSDSARIIIDHLMAEDFGKEVCTDLRQL